ncbi:hypothetical protein [Polymorphospora rubra]
MANTTTAVNGEVTAEAQPVKSASNGAGYRMDKVSGTRRVRRSRALTL